MYVRIVYVFYLVEARVRFLKIRLRLNSAHNPYISTYCLLRKDLRGSVAANIESRYILI